MFVMAVIAAGLMLFFWWWGMPQLARYYNQRGLLAMNRSKPDLLEAGGDFQRAAAIDPDAAPPYDNLGKAYEAAGLLDEAEVWYRQALERDPNFSPVYSDLGRMYILQHKLETAIWLLSAGLRVAEQNNALKEPIRYRLLQNLGWAYYAAGAYDLAQAKLEEAISLEKDNANAVGITAPPHYYLALTLEALKEPELACEHWDLSWRYPDNDFLYQAGWEQTIQERIQKCEEKNP
jgi:tetratricopeptide (TPR) repeat protein